jgi:hypothetical protein
MSANLRGKADVSPRSFDHAQAPYAVLVDYKDYH